MSRLRVAVLALVGVAAALPAWAAEGILIAQRTTNGGTTTTTQVQIERTRMRTEVAGADPQVVVFDGAKQVVYIITPSRKSYVEITRAQVEQMGAMVSGLMGQMQAQMANLPPEQRAQMEAMMRGRGMGMAGAAASPTTYKRTGSDRVGKWACDKYEGYRGGQKVSELCTAAPAAIGVTAADFAVTEQLAEFIGAVMPQARDRVSVLGRGGADGYTGFPIRSIVTVGDQATTTELTEVSRQTFSDAVFAIPAGFQKQAMPGMR
jgi:hypothetical protein